MQAIGKNISSSQHSNPLTVFYPDVPIIKIFPCMRRLRAMAIGAEFGLVLAKGEKWQLNDS